MSQLTLVSNSYLDDLSNKTRSKPVPWEGYQRAELITADELALIKRVDRQPRAKFESILVTEGRQYALLFLNLLKKLARADTMQNILVLIGDALTDHDERIPLFLDAAKLDPELPYAPFLKTLEMKDEFIQLKACQILTTILSAEPGTLKAYKFLPLLQTINNLVQGPSINGRDVGVQALEALLPRPEVRNAVWKMPTLISGLVSILKSSPGPQMTYQVAFCLWLLTFEADVAQEINKKYDIIPILTDAAQSAVKEKVVRVIIATFRNLVSRAPDANLPAMLVVKLLPFVNNLSTRKWSDEDIVEDVQYLKDELTANFQSLSTYDEYASELQSGHLSWSPVHDSDDFWKENAMKLNQKDYEQLKILINLLKNAQDPIVLAVAAHDLGQYVKHYDRGKKVVADLGAKTRVMELMGHDDPDVRYQALISVQRLISNPWKS